MVDSLIGLAVIVSAVIAYRLPGKRRERFGVFVSLNALIFAAVAFFEGNYAKSIAFLMLVLISEVEDIGNDIQKLLRKIDR